LQFHLYPPIYSPHKFYLQPFVLKNLTNIGDIEKFSFRLLPPFLIWAFSEKAREPEFEKSPFDTGLHPTQDDFSQIPRPE
jgi:hypothetical protein